jgi:tetratricopeptide (TPR) repeat protein
MAGTKTPSLAAIARAAALVLVTFAAYVPAFRAGYIWDDPDYVTQNPDLRNAEGLGEIWTGPGTPRQYYPLVFTTYWVEHHLWGDWAGGYHAVNVALQAANAVLLWVLLSRLGIPGAFLAAAIFAVHPVHVESVVWVAERKNVLSGVFYLLAALAYVRFALPDGGGPSAPGRRWRWYALAIVAFACALLSKSATCTLPVALLIVLWWKRPRLSWRDVAALLPMLAMAIASGILTGWIERHYDVGEGAAITTPLVHRFAIAGMAVWFYLGKLLFPYPLIPLYPRWEVGAWSYLLGVALLVGAVCLWFLRKRIGKWPLAALAIFVVGHGPTLGFVDFAFLFHSWVGDRFQYLPSMALIAAVCAAAAGLGERMTRRHLGDHPPADDGTPPLDLQATTTRPIPPARRRGVLGPLVGLLVVGILAAMTVSQSRIYRDAGTFFEYALEWNSQSSIAENGLGSALEEQRKLDLAAAHFRRAIALAPRFALAYMNLGTTLRKQNKFEEALRMLRRAAELAPRRAEPHLFLGILLSQKREWPGAIEELRQALRLDTKLAEGWNALGIAYRQIGRSADAVSASQQAVRLDPGVAQYRANLGDALAFANRPAEARQQYEAALRLDPACAEAHFGMGVMAFSAHRESEAIASFRRAIQLHPGWPQAMSNLAMILATSRDPALRNPKEAVDLASQAVAKAGAPNASLLSSLAAAYASGGDYPQAIETIARAIDAARAANDQSTAARLGKHLALYQAGKPLVEPAGGTPSGPPPRPPAVP